MTKINRVKAAVIGSVLLIGASIGIGIGVSQRKKNSTTSTTDANEMSVTPRMSDEKSEVGDILDGIEYADREDSTRYGDYIDYPSQPSGDAHKDGHMNVVVDSRDQDEIPSRDPKPDKVGTHKLSKGHGSARWKDPVASGIKGRKDSKDGSKTTKASEGRTISKGSAIHVSFEGKSKQEISDTIHFVMAGKPVEKVRSIPLPSNLSGQDISNDKMAEMTRHGGNIDYVGNPLENLRIEIGDDDEASNWVDDGAWHDDLWSDDGWNDDGHTIEDADSSVHVDHPTPAPKAEKAALLPRDKVSGPAKSNEPKGVEAVRVAEKKGAKGGEMVETIQFVVDGKPITHEQVPVVKTHLKGSSR